MMSVEFLRFSFLIFLGIFIIFNLYLSGRYLFIRYAPNTWKETPLWKLVVPNINLKRLVVIISEGILLLGMVGFALGIIIPIPKIIFPNSPSIESFEISPENPFKIVFDRPINVTKLEKNITPALEGTWDYKSSKYLFLKDTLIYVPKVSASAEIRYTVSLKNIESVVGMGGSDYLLSFMTPVLPTIKNLSPANGTEGFLPNQEIVVETDFPHENLARLDFKFTPDVVVETNKDNPTKYILKAKDGFKKSTTYTLDILRTLTTRDFQTNKSEDIGEAVSISQTTFRTLEAPGVADYGPKGTGVLTDTSLWIEFKQDMDQESTKLALNVEPKVDGNVAWESNRKLVFKPNSMLTKNTTYTVGISKDAKAIDGSPFEDNFSYSFTTVGYVSVSSFYPGNNSSGLALGTKVSVTFNQAVDHGSAESKFSFTPNVAGGFSWSGNTLTFTPGGLSYLTRYTTNVAAGVKSIYGLDSNQAFSSAFTTQQQSIMLNVPSYRQEHMYSCMASAARSALAFKGAYVGEDHLLSLIGYDNTPFSGTWGDPNAVWGNPYSGTVGNVDGASGGVSWGYGAYWGPTANAISNYRPAEVKNNWNVSGVASEIANGNPVIVWWVNGVWPAYEVFWKTTGGVSIRGVNSMHVQVVKGFTGTVDNPTSFTVTDSGYGYAARTMDVGTFAAKWGWFGNSAVVVR